MNAPADAARQLVDWLGRRAEPAPASLQARLTHAIRLVDPRPGESLVDLAVRTGEQQLTDALEHGCAERTAAPTLLAADALVTYAFEAAAEDVAQSAADVEACASRVASRIAAFGAGT